MAEPAGWTVRILTTLLVIVFAAAGGMKLVNAEQAAEGFAHFGYPAWFATLTGVLELAGAIGLLIRRLAPLAALGLAGVMVGALYSHLSHDPPAQALPALAILVMAGSLAWLRRGELPGAG